jgi:PAS domain S-box-containing protein
MRALLVEADESTRTGLRAILEERGWQATVVGSTESAFERFRAESFPLVVVPATPATDGAADLVRRIRALPRGEEACVLVTHTGPLNALDTLIAAGADDAVDLRSAPKEVGARFAFARNRARRGARRNTDDLVHVFERALRESEVRYRALFDQSPVGVFLCDRNLRINDINERLRQITGLPRGRMLGASLRDPVQPPIPGLEDVVAGETASYDGPYLHPDGSQLWVTVRYAPLRDPDGAVVGGIGVVEDVSERHRAEQRLHVQAAELERVNSMLRERTLALEDAMQARTRLYTSMNHELRTPISAIMLYQELLLTGALGGLTGEQQQAVERSHTATRHLLELVCDILDLSKLEAGRLVLHPCETRLPELLEDLLGTMLPLTERYGSRLLVELPPGLPSVVTDPQRVRQILLNLVSNAAKFGRGRPIVIRGRPSGSATVVIEVADEGIGIASEDLERIFDDFVQVGSPPETGTGLGLSISRRLATLLDGRLEVESVPGVGSTFRLTLPSAFRPEAAMAAGLAD